MSTAPNFSTVLFVGENNLRLFYLPQKNWHSLDADLNLDSDLPAEAKKRIQGENVLVVVSDSFNGHLQFTQENKKTALQDEAILSKLEEDFEIDTQAYHLDWKSFSVNRQVVQLCVSGIEQDTLDKVTAWLEPAQPKKVWAMPFAWFVSPLKSVDPALIAIYDQDKVHVSHHYLGIDDARVLSLDDLDKYVAARREERKETHLLYVAASNKDRSQLDKAIKQEEVTTQSLLEESSSDVLLDVVTAATEKGQGAWNELWHYDLTAGLEAETTKEEDQDKEELPAVATTTTDSKTESSEEPASADAASSLPVPTPPPSVSEVGEPETVVSSSADEEPMEDEAEANLEEDLSENSKEDQTPVVEKEEEPEPVAEKEPTNPKNVASAETKVAATDTQEESAALDASETEDKDSEPVVETPKLIADNEEEQSLDKASSDDQPEKETKEVEPEKPVVKPVLTEQLKGSGVKANNAQRYAEVEESRSWKGPILVFFMVVILTALVGGAIFWSQEGAQYLGFIDTFVEQPTPTPTPTPEATMEPTPEATQEAQLEEPEVTSSQKEETSIIVLNATGVAGLAGRTRTTLQEAGWEDVAVGNASGTYNDADFIVTQDESLTTVLSTDLDRELKKVESVKEPQASSYDVVIILAAD